MNEAFQFFNSGGYVIWVLLGISFFIYSQLYKHYQDIKFLKKNDKELEANEKLIKALIAVSPLLGLLGTVGGMIETFASLETMEVFKPGGGIAGGISQALLTTQLGLIVAVPPMLLLKFVNSKKREAA